MIFKKIIHKIWIKILYNWLLFRWKKRFGGRYGGLVGLDV